MQAFLGENSLENLKGFDIIFRSPSCLPTKPELQAEIKRGAIVTTEIELLKQEVLEDIFEKKYENGDEDFSDLISNWYLVSEITSYDTDLLEKIEKKKNEKEKKVTKPKTTAKSGRGRPKKKTKVEVKSLATAGRRKKENGD